MRSDLIVAIDIGGTKLAVGTADRRGFAETGRLSRVVKEPIPYPGRPEGVIPRVIELALLLADAEGGTISSAGISIGGPLDHENGVVLNFPHLPGWRDIPLAAEIARLLGAPTALDNDANLGALAEQRLGAGKGFETMVYMTVSTGIGGGIILGGKLLHGVASGAGEVGHVTVATDGPVCPCGNRGCLEVMASGRGIARRAAEAVAAHPERGARLLELAGGSPAAITSESVHAAVDEGDELALSIWNDTAEYIAIGLGSIIHVLAPPLIVLGGGVAQTGESLLKPVRERLRDHVFYIPLDRISVVGAGLRHDSALLGAALLAHDIGRDEARND